MSDKPPEQAQVVIIGGGVIGCSVAYHLTRAGWTDVVLLERKSLTSGTTWACGGPDRTAPRHPQHDAPRPVHHRGSVGPRGGNRSGHRLQAERGLARDDRRRAAHRAQAQRLHGPMLRPRGPGAVSGGSPGPVAAVERRRPDRRSLHPERGADQSRRHDVGLRQGRAYARGADLRERQGHGHTSKRRTGHGSGDGRRRHPRGVRRQLWRHVGSRDRPPGGGQRASSGRRALLRRDRADRGVEPRYPVAARAERGRLRQGGRGQAARGRVREGGQALGHGRHSRGLRVRSTARGLGPLRAHHGECPASYPGPRGDGRADVLLRAGELHAG